jgi:hypothetical protein
MKEEEMDKAYSTHRSEKKSYLILLGNLRRRWKDHIKLYLKEIGWEVVG